MRFDIFQTQSREIPNSDIKELPCRDAKIILGKSKNSYVWYWSDKLSGGCYLYRNKTFAENN